MDAEPLTDSRETEEQTVGHGIGSSTLEEVGLEEVSLTEIEKDG